MEGDTEQIRSSDGVDEIEVYLIGDCCYRRCNRCNYYVSDTLFVDNIHGSSSVMGICRWVN